MVAAHEHPADRRTQQVASTPTSTTTPAASATDAHGDIGHHDDRHQLDRRQGGGPDQPDAAERQFDASKAAGIAEVLNEGSADGVAIVAQNMPPNANKPPNAYAVWLYNSPTDAQILGFVNPGVGKHRAAVDRRRAAAQRHALQAADRDPGDHGEAQEARGDRPAGTLKGL